MSLRKELLPPVRIFYEQQLGKLSRPSRGWVKANCCFHRSKSKTSFSIHLDSGAFRCFGCDVHGGDIVDFTKLRHRCDFKTAIMILGASEDVSHHQGAELARRTAQKKKERDRLAEVEQAERIKLLELRDQIHLLAAIQRETSDRLGQLLQGAEPVCDDEAERCWDVLSLVLDDLQLTEDEYMNLAGLDGAA